MICHKPSGVTLQTPLLVPSFSSKGFAVSKKDKVSEIGKILTASGEFITETFLISAYDVHHGHIPEPADLPYSPELIFLDSGGYEISTDRDYSSVIDPLPAPEPWSQQKLEAILDSWPEEMPAVFTSYDNHAERKPFAEQVACARQLFKTRRNHLHAILLKPETTGQTTLAATLKAARADAEELGSFDIVGVTEKELGKSMLDRMVQIAKLRRSLDEAGVKSPIHVFGALDPLTVCLYFVSGAEIFDGLTWIRYGYHNGCCVYTHNLGVLKYGIHTRDDSVRTRSMRDNIYRLEALQQRLQEFEATNDLEKLRPHDGVVSDALDSLATKLKGKS